ncbi:MAG: acetyl-CoA acetyltransferase [bacterium]
MQTTGVLGGYQSDFARNLDREGSDIGALTREIVEGTLTAAGIRTEQIDTIHVGNAFGQLYTGQGHLGAMPATVVPGLCGVPAMRHEAACASGSLAVLAAMAELEAGRYDCALVLGIEQEKTMPGPAAAEVQHAAALVGQEEKTPNIWPCMFDTLAAEYDRRYGLDEAHLREIGRINLGNAKANPNAQTRSWRLEDASFAADDDHNPVIAGRLRRNDCCQITDGGAGLVLVSERWLADHPDASTKSRIVGWGHRTVGLALAPKLDRSRDQPFVMPHVRSAIEDAFQRAGVPGVEALDLIETHDCMTPSEYMAIDHFGITAPGESWKAIEEGALQRDGRMPVNPSGGLMGVGHPVGATGVRMLVDATLQVSDRAGDYQVENARRAATLNIGGSTTTTVSFVVETV